MFFNFGLFARKCLAIKVLKNCKSFYEEETSIFLEEMKRLSGK